MMAAQIFKDRRAAGAQLARAIKVADLKGPLLVLGLPRGGVPVAHEVARTLRAPLDVIVVRKIGMPGQPELAAGALAAGDVLVRGTGLPALDSLTFERLAESEHAELLRRERKYRSGGAPRNLSGRTVILVDDGLATGATMLAAIRAARKGGATRVVAAAPVASDEAVSLVGAEADRLIVLEVPGRLSSIGEWYEDFTQVGDAEVCELLARGRSANPRPGKHRSRA